MATPALNIPIRVIGTDDFKRKMNETSSLVAHTTRTVAAQVIKMNASWLASQGAAGAATLAFGRVLGVLGPIALGITAVVDAFKLMGYATDLAKKKIEEFSAIADKANASGFSTGFFQRITKSGGEARDKIDELTVSLKRFNDASAPKLGGSDLQQRLDELKKAGNLSGNTGVAALSSANTTEERFRATVSLINQMMSAGERLAALDIANRAFGPAVTAALRADSSYLDDMLKRADALSKTKIVSDDDLGRAVELKERMEAAQKVLAERWKPIQDDLAKLGMNYHESWVSITEDLAAAVGYATQLYQALKQVPDWFANRIGNASIWKSLTDATGAMGLNSDPAAMGVKPVGSVSREEAQAKLRAALQNHANVTRGMRETTDVQSAVRGDTSKDTSAKAIAESSDQFDRASEAIAKHTARLEADAQAVGLGVSALEELRAKSALLTAAQQAGLPVNDALIAKINALAKAAGEAGDKLAKAKINGQISFGRQTALLSPEDTAIAAQLKGQFGDDVPRALASSEAAALRLNSALKEVSTSISGSLVTGFTDMLDGTKSVSQGFSDMSRTIIRALEEAVVRMMIVAPIMKGLQALLGFSDGGIVGGSPLAGAANFIGPVLKADGGMIRGPGGPRDDRIPIMGSDGEFMVNAASTAKHRALLEAINSDKIPHFADGGLVGAASPSAAPMIGAGNVVSIAPHVAVTVQGSPGSSPAEHAAMGETIARQVGPAIQQMVAIELRSQMRPGGLLAR